MSWEPTKVTRVIFAALENLGGEADIDAIVKASKMSDRNGTSVSLGSLMRRGYVKCTVEKRYFTRWKIVKPLPPEQKKRKPKPQNQNRSLWD